LRFIEADVEQYREMMMLMLIGTETLVTQLEHLEQADDTGFLWTQESFVVKEFIELGSRGLVSSVV
jgi:hypothetical protein